MSTPEGYFRAYSLMRSGDYKYNSLKECIARLVWAQERKRETLAIMINVTAKLNPEKLETLMRSYMEVNMPGTGGPSMEDLDKLSKEVAGKVMEISPLDKVKSRGIIDYLK